MGVADAKSPAPDTATEMLEGGIRALVRRNKLAVAAELIAEPTEDALIAGATSIADIGKLMEELETARDYLHYEGERLRQMTARYAHLAQTASASVKVIAESLGKWRKAETASLEDPAMPRAHAPDLSPVDSSRIERSVAPASLAHNAPARIQPRRGRCRACIFFAAARHFDKWIPKTIFAAPRNSSPRGGASYNNRKAS